MQNHLRRLARIPQAWNISGKVPRFTLALVIIAALSAGEESQPVPSADPTKEVPFSLQLNHELVGAIGKPFQVTVHLYSSHLEDFTYDGEIVDAKGQLKLTGKWDLILEEILDERVIASRSLKISDGTAVPPLTLTAHPYKEENVNWTWDAQSAFTHIGNYRFHLRYGDRSYDGEQFRIDKTLDPPPWIQVTVTPDKQRAVVGEPVLVTVQVKNTGTDSYPASFGGDYRGASRALRFYCTAERADGTTGSDPEPLQSCMGGIGEFGPLDPGNSRERQLSLGAYVRCPAAGRYRVTVYHALGFGTPVPGIDSDSMAGFGRYAKAGEFTLDLDAPMPGDAERIVRTGLSAKGEYERYQRLGHLHEPYFLEALQEVLVQPNLAEYGPVLIDGIDSIRTTAATAALIKALDHPSPATRARALERLRFRMPQPDWSMHSPQSQGQVARQRLQDSLIAQTWNEDQSSHLRTKLQTMIASTDENVLRGAIDLLGNIGDVETVEEIARIADRLGPTAELLTQNAVTMNHLENAAYTLGLRKIAPPTIGASSTLGRRICWARMLEGSQIPPTAETDALLVAMVSDRSKDVRLAALGGMSKDAGARLALPWKSLFLDEDLTVFHSACHLSEQAPNATIALIVHECLQQDPPTDRRAYFKMMLQHIEPSK
jgi:hypothetical protein